MRGNIMKIKEYGNGKYKYSVLRRKSEGDGRWRVYAYVFADSKKEAQSIAMNKLLKLKPQTNYIFELGKRHKTIQ